MITLHIDGHSVTVPDGTKLITATRLAGAKVPTLCADDKLEPYGSCRMCLVEVEGMRGTPASCTLPVRDGMIVHTQSARLDTLRKGVLDLYLSDHPLECSTCTADGDCELQTVAHDLGVTESTMSGGDTHWGMGAVDDSNPYFRFDPEKCIVCARCVRACDEVQGTYALTLTGNGFASRVVAGANDPFLASDCVSCGACVDACPTGSLYEKVTAKPNREVKTTCAYCGVGCGFVAELNGDTVVRMTPDDAAKANEGHACVKGRFAFGYASHADRVRTPLIRNSIDEPWRAVSWDEAIAETARRLLAIKAEHGPKAIGGLTSSRCTNEETYLVQKMIRTSFGSNNVDTCARVCHSPTGYGLKVAFGTSAGTQDFRSVASADVVLVIGANPTDGHPVFASRLRRRLREGAKLIVMDPRRIDLVDTPHAAPGLHLPVLPGTNVALMNAVAHVIEREGLANESFIRERCDAQAFATWRAFIRRPENAPEAVSAITGVPAEDIITTARLFARGPNSAIYYGLGVTEHTQGSTMVMAMANLAMLTGNIGRDGVGVNPLRGQNNVQGSCDMGSFPHELPGYRHISDQATRALFEAAWGVTLDPEPGLRLPNMLAKARDGQFKAMFIQGEDIAQSDPDTLHVEQALRAMDCVIVQDLFLNETARFAHIFLPGASFLEKDGTFTNAERRISRVRKAIEPLAGLAEWQSVALLATALGQPMHYDHPSEIMDEIAALTPTFAGVSYEMLDAAGSLQWPVNDSHPLGSPIMHVDGFTNGAGHFSLTEYVPTPERTSRKFPLILTTGRILSQYNVGAQTRRTANMIWHDEDVLEIHPHDAEHRGIRDGDLVRVDSRAGDTTLHALITERVPPGVVYTTFHHPDTGVNVVTTENSDWATNCPEYKVTAVEVRLTNARSSWQDSHAAE